MKISAIYMIIGWLQHVLCNDLSHTIADRLKGRGGKGKSTLVADAVLELEVLAVVDVVGLERTLERQPTPLLLVDQRVIAALLDLVVVPTRVKTIEKNK